MSGAANIQKQQQMNSSNDSMSQMMHPRSIAILGASTDPGKFSNRPLVYLANLGFKGAVYPVNPEAESIEGFKCYRSLDDIAGPIDVVVVARPAASVVSEVERCLARGIRAFVVFSAGFAEAGPEGAVLQARLVELCKNAGAVLCGPNCTGIVDVPGRAALSFMTNLDQEVVDGGTVALVSGSGSVAAIVYQGRGRIFRSVASIGNEAVSTGADFIAHAVEEPGISGVVAFLEAIRDPERLITALGRATLLGKPVAILKGGRTAQSAEVAATHTGALIDDDTAIQAMFERYNVIRADSLEELKTLAVLMHAASTRSIGPGIGVLTPSGGTAVLIVDEVLTHGLTLPQLEDATRAALQEIIPQATPGNPMDITGFGASSPQILSRSIESMLADPGIDVVLVPMGGGVGKVGSSRAQVLIDVAAKTNKLLVPIWQGTTRDQPGYDAMLAAGLPAMTDYAILTSALGKLARHRQRCQEAQAAGHAADDSNAPALLPAAAQRLIEAARTGSATSLSEPDVKAIFAAADISVPRAMLIGATAGARQAGQGLAFPAILKIVSRDISHKSAVSGVAIVQSDNLLDRAVADMRAAVTQRAPQAAIEGFLLEEMVNGGLELMVGIKRDARFGTLISFGMGGTWANAFKGAVTALLPLSPTQAEQLIHRFFASIDDPAAVAVLAEFLTRVGAIAGQLGERLDILEINPVKLIGSGSGTRTIALDGVLTLTSLAT